MKFDSFFCVSCSFATTANLSLRCLIFAKTVVFQCNFFSPSRGRFCRYVYLLSPVRGGFFPVSRSICGFVYRM